MLHLEGFDTHRAFIQRHPSDVLAERHFVAALYAGRSREEGLCGSDETGFDPRGPDYSQRCDTLADVLGVQQPPNEACEVIPMQVRNENRRNGIRINAEP